MIFKSLLVATILSFALFIVEAFYLPMSIDAYFYAEFLVSIILFDSAHIGFSFFLLLIVPNFKQMVLELKAQRIFIWRNCFYIGSAVFALVFSSNLILVFLRMEIFSIFIFQIWLLFLTQHSLYQRFGISNIYLRNLDAGKAEKDEILKGERYLVNFIFVFTVIATSLFWSKGEWGLQLESVRDPGLRSLVGGLILVQVAIITAYLIFEKYKFKNTNKRVIQLLRYYFYPLSFMTFAGALLSRLFHVFEYFWIFRILTSAEKRAMGSFLFYFIMVLTSIIPVAANLGQRLLCFEQGESCNAWLFSGINAIVISASAMHMYLDRISFNFKNPIIHKNLVPLLKAKT